MRRIITLFIALACFSSALSQPGAKDPNVKIKAIFLYNFTKYIVWPADYKEGDFIIGVLGESSLINELSKMAQTKKVGRQNIVIKKYNSVNEIGKCHILCIPQESSTSLNEVIKKLNGNSTLIITNKEGLAKKGAAINFKVEASKQRFELNTANATKYNLKVSANLSALAIVVN
ncbi:MAG: YfiR family protein [Bacteroidetes bacterium]|nr:YfiR family protein [Bacteroidota bacterium]